MEWEINLVLWVQSLGQWLVGPMRLFSFFGNEEFYLIFLPLIYWCLDPLLGLRLSFLAMFSFFSNTAFKQLFCAPRPYWVDSRVVAFSSESSFGFPSGHSQNSAAIFGILASVMPNGRAILRGFFLLLIFLVGLSRIYLGVHFGYQVLTGWLIGFILLFLFLRYEKRVVSWYIGRSPRAQGVIIVLSTVFCLLLLVGMVTMNASWQMPALWLQNALAASVESAPKPVNIEDAFTMSGLWFGMIGGVTWFLNRCGFHQVEGTFMQKALRYILGIAILMIIWSGLKMIFPTTADALGLLLRFVRYALTSFWAWGLAPWVFQKVGLAKAG